MAGVRLAALESSDLVDVLHFLFEDDAANVYSAEQAKARDTVRKQMYRSLYDKEYKYGFSDTAVNDFSGIDDPIDFDDDTDEPPTPVDPFTKSASIKPYTPPTRLDPDSPLPFGKALDAPLR